MEAKETVMTQDDFEEWCGSHQIKGCGKTKTMCEDYCRPLAQAEISFKAGREEGFILSKVTDPVLSSKAEHKELNRRATAFLDDIKKAGIKEVVEWISKNVHLYLRNDNSFIDALQAKLKEWGIE